MEDDGSTSSEPPSSGGGSLTVDIVDMAGVLGAQGRAWLSSNARRVFEGRCGEVRARVVGDGEMAAAHERWSGVPGTTDVLTFDLSGPDSAGLDVDLLICFDEAARQASARGHAVERELLLYIVHGVLHCLGFDDHDESGSARMHAEEDRLLSAAGIGAVYATSGESSGGAASGDRGSAGGTSPSHTGHGRAGRVAPVGVRERDLT